MLEGTKMSTLPLDKKVLYSTTFCAYREYSENKVLCQHAYSFKVCDLDLCPIAQEYFANIVFLPEGITLVVKEPSEEKVAGEWRKVPLTISPNLDNEEELIDLIKKEAKGINEKNMKALTERLHRILSRYRFLKEKGKELPIIQQEIRLEEEEVQEMAEEEFDESEGTG